MKDYPIASIVTGFATIVVAFVNALSGEPVAVIISVRLNFQVSA